MDIHLRGELWDNDSANVLRWHGWRDLTAPMDVAAALERAGGEEVTILVNSPGGNMVVGSELYSMFRRYRGKLQALIQGYAASAATMAIGSIPSIRSEPGALLCYHNPSSVAQGDFRDMAQASQGLLNARDSVAGIQLTGAMRSQYQAHVATQRAAEHRQEQAQRTIARMRAIAYF